MSRERAMPIAIVGAGVLVIAAIVWFALKDNGDDTDTVPSGAAQLTTPADLASLAREIGHPIYWLGERSGTQLELTKKPEGSIYVRYLSEDAEVGDPSSDFLTVGTYPVGEAEAAVRRAAKQNGAKLHPVPGGGIVFLSPEGRTSAYLALPGSEEQIEVYDPVAGRALELVEAGRVVPAG